MEPWQKREGEQQRFVEKLADTIREAAEDSGNYTVFMIEFSISLLRTLQFIASEKAVNVDRETEFFRYAVLSQIADFTLIESEMTYLIGRLLEKLSVSIYSFSQWKYQSNCIADPETAYGSGK